MHKLFVEAGFRTIPLRGKIPQRKAWQNTEFSEEPIEGNFGIVLDADHLVIDIDIRNGGAEGFKTLCRHCGVNLELLASIVVFSGRRDGGRHLYFSKDPEISIRGKHKDYPGVDFLSKGDFVVAAGSVHPDTGKKYYFKEGEPTELKELNPVHKLVISAIERKHTFDHISALDEDELDQEVDIEEYIEYLDKADIAVEGEGGDEQTFRVAAKGHDLGLSKDKTTELMLEHWNDKCDPPWDDVELDKKVENAHTYAQGAQGAISVMQSLKQMDDYAKEYPSVLTIPEDLPEQPSRKPELKERQTWQGPEYSKAETQNAVIFKSKHFPEGGILTHDDQLYAFNGKFYDPWSDEKLTYEVHKDLQNCAFKLSVITNTAKAIKIDSYKENFKLTENAICFDNGVLVLKNNGPVFVNHDKKYICTDMIEQEFKLENNKPKNWLKFLNSSLEGDKDRIALLQEWMGYNLMRGNPFQKICLLIGASRSGKGVIGRVLTNMTHGAGTSLAGLCTEFGLSGIYQHKTAIIGDAHQATNFERAKEVLLTISGQDKVDINRKFKGIISTTLDTKITMLANAMPTFADGSDALINRYLVIPFHVSFSGKEDMFLDQKLEEELSQIIAWAVEGFYRVKKSNGRFTIGEHSKEALEDIGEDSNPIKSFVNQFCEVEEGAKVTTNELYAQYKDYIVNQQGFKRALTKANFGKQLKLVNGTIKSKRTRGGSVYEGIKLKGVKVEETDNTMNLDNSNIAFGG